MAKDKFARLRAARSGKKIEDEPEEDYAIYEEVDDLEYRKHKRDQILNDDFVVDEDGDGYAETGADDWDQPHDYYSDEEQGSDKDNQKSKKKKVRKVKKSITPNVANFFSIKSSSTNLDNKPKKRRANDNLDDILNDFTSKATSTSKSTPFMTSSSRKRDVFSSLKNDHSRVKTPSKSVKPLNYRKMLDDDNLQASKKQKTSTSSDTEFYTAIDFEDSSMDLDSPSSPIKNKTSNKDVLTQLIDNDEFKAPSVAEIKSDSTDPVKQEESDSDDSDDDIILAKRPRASAKVNRTVNISAIKQEPKPLNSSPLKNEILTSSNPPSSPTRFADTSFNRLDEDQIAIKSEDGTKKEVQMYWLDYAEVGNKLLLFGKVKTNDGKLVSGLVQVSGICRQLFFLPREADEETPAKTTDDVLDEMYPLVIGKYGVESLQCKAQTMKYAFEVPGIPKEAEYLMMRLPFNTPKQSGVPMPHDLESDSFSKVFGTNQNIFEAFVLQRNIMGPCWLSIKNCDFDSLQNSSHCSVEIAVSKPEDITPMDVNDPAPSLNVLSINVQPMMNLKAGKQEVGSVSIALYKNLPQDQPIDEHLKPDELMTLVRPVGGSTTLPVGLSQLARKKGISIRTFNKEKVLLNCLCALIKKSDPDVFAGHRLENVSLDILMHRMHDLGVTGWSNFGRINRRNFPDKFGRSSTNNVFLLREIFSGRLICDIANEMGQSLTTKCQSWELQEMYEVVCKKKYVPMEVNLANPTMAEEANHLLAAFNENNMSVQIIGEIAFRIQILSLSKQLTNLAGNAWAHTLGGTRAGRNEFILLHEFTREGYVVPDKETRAQRQQQTALTAAQTDENGVDQATITSSRKAKFQGGLVFEPEKGLHKNYVLVMDFNSLYPSIIQEFNICFTTVNRSDLSSDTELPNIPSSDSHHGVLPKLLQQLVNRRREVKKLMKDSRITPVEKVQYDIKQQALKLTANSMYGCLGYVNSRFYAKPLAMLVTNKGREILMDTRQLAESIGLRVVYGDTDSVMIDSGCNTYKDAIKIAEDFKAKVNERYKLLEIDTDNVFKRLLLHSKKKYAALNTTITKDGQEITNLEVKGLDLKRREYCPLSKDTSLYILDKVLGDADPEESLNEIYSYLEDITTKLRNNEFPMVKLKINTRLSKDPTKYPSGKTMPAVQVALRLRDQGKIIKAGNVITFVITDEGIDHGKTVAERARALTEVLPKDSQYKVDASYYLEKQLLAPIERLLAKVEGADIVRLAASLGLDSKRYEARARQQQQLSNENLQPLESTIPDKERFRDSKSFHIICPHCSSNFIFGGIQSSNDYQITFSGIKCTSCQNMVPSLSISAQLEHLIRHEISLYYAGWLVCDTCTTKTRQVGVLGRRCLGTGDKHGCNGVMNYVYTDKHLYNQLLFLQSLFDVDKAKKGALKPLHEESEETENKENKPHKLNQGELDALSEQNRLLFGVFCGVVNKYLGECGRRYVDMGSIFGFMNK